MWLEKGQFYCKFLDVSNVERILKIDQHLVKLLTKTVVGLFTHTARDKSDSISLSNQNRTATVLFEKRTDPERKPRFIRFILLQHLFYFIACETIS